MEISQALNEYRLQGALSFLALGDDPAMAHVYSGEQPAFGGNPTGTSTLLVSIPLSEPLGTVADGVLHVAQSAEGLIMHTGAPAWCRVVNGSGQLAWDCTASGPLGSGELKLDLDILYAGGSARIASGTIA